MHENPQPLEQAVLADEEQLIPMPAHKTGRTPNPVYSEDVQLIAGMIPNKPTNMIEFGTLGPIAAVVGSLPAYYQVSMLNIFKVATRILQTGPVLFRTTAGLEQALDETDLMKSSMDFLKPPHEAFEFILSDGVPESLVVHNPLTGEHRLGYILMQDDNWYCEQDDKYYPALRVVFVGHPNEKSKDDHDNAVTYASFPYNLEECNIGDWIEKETEGFLLRGPQAAKMSPEEFVYLKRLMRFAAKLILYVNSPQCDETLEVARAKTLAAKIDRLTEGKKGREKAQKKKAERLKLDYERLPAAAFFDHRTLGSSIVIDRGARVEHSEGSRTGRELTSRVEVRAHFHTYWVGKGRTDRRVNWISKHYRGPDAAEVIAKRTYKVK